MSFIQTPLLPGVSRRGALDQRRWIQRAAAVSVLLHLMLAGFLVYRAPPTPPAAPADALPSVELVFDEAASRSAPTPGAPPLPAPVPSLAEPPAPPPSPEPLRPPAPARSPPPAPPPAPSVANAPPVPPAPDSPPFPNTAAAPAAPPRPAAPPAIAAPPAPAPREAPPVLAAPLPLPGPPPPAAPPEPQPRVAAPAPPRTTTPPPPRPEPAPQEIPRPTARPQPRPDQPTPPALAGTRFIPDATLGSLRPPQTAPAPQRRAAPEQLAMGPDARPDRPNATPAARTDENVAGATLRITGANLGADWRAAFMEWLRRNGRFPREAAMNGEDGTNIVRFEVDRDGRVQSVRLTSRSGSQWLDVASTALLRDRTIPPFPPGTESNNATIDLTIHYILVRR